MSDSFAVLDFALVAASPAELLQALAEAEPPRRRGWLRRLLGKTSGTEGGEGAALQAYPAGHLARGVLAREVIDDLGFGGTDRAMRLSAPIGTHPAPELAMIIVSTTIITQHSW